MPSKIPNRGGCNGRPFGSTRLYSMILSCFSLLPPRPFIALLGLVCDDADVCRALALASRRNVVLSRQQWRSIHR